MSYNAFEKTLIHECSVKEGWNGKKTDVQAYKHSNNDLSIKTGGVYGRYEMEYRFSNYSVVATSLGYSVRETKYNYADIKNITKEKQTIIITFYSSASSIKINGDEKIISIIYDKLPLNRKTSVSTNKNMSAKSSTIVSSSKDSVPISKGWAWAIFIVVMLIGLFVFGGLGNDSSQWNSLSDDKKEWYQDNYGDGQYDDIQNAIDDYND